MSEEHGEAVTPAVLLDHVRVGVADARRFEPDEHLAGPGLLDADLLERDLARPREDYASVSHVRSSSRTERAPSSARVSSISAIRF